MLQVDDEKGHGGQPVVVIVDRGPVRVLTLNRPERRNAFDLALRVELADALEAAASSPHVRAIVVTGAGGSFCAGGDLSTMDDLTPVSVRHRTSEGIRVPAAIRGGDTPVVAAVEGAAYGAGLSLAMVCDHVVAARDARFGAAFSKVGLGGDFGITLTLPERIGVARARRMLLFAEVLDAESAEGLGMVDALVDPGAALERAVADATRLAAAPPLAVAAIRRQVHAAHPDFDRGLVAEGDEQVALLLSEDLQEGIAAFREGRPPTFRGR